jgi:hypothetical protein
MPDAPELLERQARWQQGRTALTWAEKVRLAERVRESAKILRATAEQPSGHHAARLRAL